MYKRIAVLFVIATFAVSFGVFLYTDGLKNALLILASQLIICAVIYVVLALVSADDRGKTGWEIFKIW